MAWHAFDSLRLARLRLAWLCFDWLGVAFARPDEPAAHFAPSQDRLSRANPIQPQSGQANPSEANPSKANPMVQAPKPELKEKSFRRSLEVAYLVASARVSGPILGSTAGAWHTAHTQRDFRVSVDKCSKWIRWPLGVSELQRAGTARRPGGSQAFRVHHSPAGSAGLVRA